MSTPRIATISKQLQEDLISRSRSVKLVYFGFLFSIRIKTNGLFIASFKITKAIPERMMVNFQLLDFICLPASRFSAKEWLILCFSDEGPVGHKLVNLQVNGEAPSKHKSPIYNKLWSEYCSWTEMWNEWPKRENRLIPCKITHSPSLPSKNTGRRKERESVFPSTVSTGFDV